VLNSQKNGDEQEGRLFGPDQKIIRSRGGGGRETAPSEKVTRRGEILVVPYKVAKQSPRKVFSYHLVFENMAKFPTTYMRRDLERLVYKGYK